MEVRRERHVNQDGVSGKKERKSKRVQWLCRVIVASGGRPGFGPGVLGAGPGGLVGFWRLSARPRKGSAMDVTHLGPEPR